MFSGEELVLVKETTPQKFEILTLRIVQQPNWDSNPN
jgi:hypothetical protein